MLLFCLLAFAFTGILSRFLAGSRVPVILLLSAGSIALLSPTSLLLCVFVTALNFSLLMAGGKKIILAASLLLNLFILAAFHYYEILYKEFDWAGIPAVFGVTFLALQHIDYSFKVYYGQNEKPAHFMRYITAVLYLPKFFSGPIASLPAIQEQLENSFTSSSINAGLNRILLGLFKKLVLAASLEPMVHSVLDHGDAYPGLTLLAAACLYSLQLYFDFSGYTDLALGASHLWAIQLPENFHFPFRQKSWSAFWKSWHASLTEWLWQYLFNPVFLYFARKGFAKKLAVLLCCVAVFAGMAFFNGIQSGFYISGAIFALLYAAEILFDLKPARWRAVPIFLFFSFALLFFRNPEPDSYFFISRNLLNAQHFVPADWLSGFLAPLASGGTQHAYFNLAVSLVLCFVFILSEKKISALFSGEKVHYAAWFVMILLLFTWGVFGSGERFIYMQF